MTEPKEGGRRRLDRVLAADYLADPRGHSLAELRGLRHDAEQEEADLSYLRRLLQGRVDIVRAEQARREPGGGDKHVLAHLSEILADEPRGAAHGLGRFITVEPSRADEHRRAMEQAMADVDISDVEARTDAELAQALERLATYEHDISAARQAVQAVMDACTAEITRRYREGEAQVDDLLHDDRRP